MSKLPPSKRQKIEGKSTASSSHYSNYEFWLMKSEYRYRSEMGTNLRFSFEDLEQCPNMTTSWEGVRNYQARNYMRDDMKIGHQIFFYRSNCTFPGIVGIAEVVKESYPDHTQFDKTSYYYDSSSTPDAPRWFMVDIKFVRRLENFITLSLLRRLYEEHNVNDGPLRNMALFTSSRLSVLPVSKEAWEFILSLEKGL